MVASIYSFMGFLDMLNASLTYFRIIVIFRFSSKNLKQFYGLSFCKKKIQTDKPHESSESCGKK